MKKTKKFFDQLADTWEDQNFPPEIRKRVAELAETFDIQEGARVLDVATGTGILLPYLLRAVGESGRVFAFDFCGIYYKPRFRTLPGFDHTIKNPYWQNLDFGFTSFLWGEKIKCSTSFLLQYQHDVPQYDNTPDDDYKTFFLKNLCVGYKKDRGILPIKRIAEYINCSNTGPLSSFKEFMAVKRWIKLNRYRYKQDSRSLVELWEVPE